jgi:sugar/nucleoside kinase (ribokinase family)
LYFGLQKKTFSQKVKFCYNKKIEKIPTGTCLILITPDYERTMCTFLGIAGKISPGDIDENLVKPTLSSMFLQLPHRLVCVNSFKGF